jgi:uncharacterized membrane protein YbaN (DUF454 family)
MNPSEAKQILQLYRPGTDDAADRKVAEALVLAQRDPELATWLEQHNRFQDALREKFQEIPVPQGLKESILAKNKIVRPQFAWHQSTWFRVAAAFVALIGLYFVINGGWLKSVPDRFADYEGRMVRSALREYRMELLTDDIKQLRQLMASKGAPADFAVPQGLSRLQLTGGGVLRWRNHPVSMVCFNRGDDQMLFLFVIDRSAVKNPPAGTPEVAKVSKLTAASWTEGEKTYLLAGPDDAEFLQKYF